MYMFLKNVDLLEIENVDFVDNIVNNTLFLEN
jgi:hypothetical protein